MEDREALFIRIERLREIVQREEGDMALNSVVKELAEIYSKKNNFKSYDYGPGWLDPREREEAIQELEHGIKWLEDSEED